VGRLPEKELLDTRKGIVLDDTQLVVQVLAVALQLVVDDLRCALVALDSLAREHLHVDYRTRDAGGHAQARVLHVRSLLAKDRPQELFFRRELRLALRRDLAYQHVAGLHFGADVDDAWFVETAELRFAKARDIASD